MKICKECNKEKELSFFPGKKRKGLRTNVCWDCHHKMMAMLNLSKKLINRHKTEDMPFEISPKSDSCQICGNKGIIVFDHCHELNLFRGWICRECNLVLGLVKDDCIRLVKMIAYLIDFYKKNGL